MKTICAFVMLLSMSACAPAMAYDGDGRFETREQVICVCSGRYERFWDGRGWASYYTPPRYERQLIQVWIPARHGGGSLDFKINWNWRTW